MQRTPSGGGGGSLLELQKYLEPQIEHVQQVTEERQAAKDDAVPPPENP
jgi:hypothetical protein